MKILNKKCKNAKELQSPFDSHPRNTETNFNEKEIKKRLKQIIPKKDHKFINHFINDKKYYFQNDLKVEKGVFRDNNSYLIGLVKGDEKGFNIPYEIKKRGIGEGLGSLTHNHPNGLIIPSLKDLKSMLIYRSKYNIIYSHDKNGLLINSDVLKNKENWKKISNIYDKFLEDTKTRIEKIYPKESKKIKTQYLGDELNNQLDKIYRQYSVNNQEKIVKEINFMFKDNDFNLKIYIF